MNSMAIFVVEKLPVAHPAEWGSAAYSHLQARAESQMEAEQRQA
jgi:hypothetical protein